VKRPEIIYRDREVGSYRLRLAEGLCPLAECPSAMHRLDHGKILSPTSDGMFVKSDGASVEL
jgi:hypothetical protein